MAQQPSAIRLIGIGFAVFILVLFLPELLTGLNSRRGILVIYSPSSYLSGFGLTVTAASFSLLGCGVLNLLRLSPTLIAGKLPFLGVLVGQASLFLYIYVRSAFNHYVIYIPVTIIEFVLIFAVLYCFLLKHKYFAGLRNEIHTYRWQWLVGFGALFFLCTALYEHECPRDVMLSSDPDYHAFFAMQIRRFGMVPYNQFDWGPLPFRYPAGTGLLGFLWSVASGLDVRDATTIQPLLQAYFAVFMLVNVVSVKSHGIKVTALIYFSVISLFSYLLTYSMDAQHYQLEGTGRLSTIAMFSSVICFFMILTKASENILISSLFRLIFLFCVILLYGIAINPTNGIYAGLLFGVIIFSTCIKQFRRWPMVMCLLIIIPLMALDPFYKGFLFNSITKVFAPTEETRLLEKIKENGNASGNKVKELKLSTTEQDLRTFVVNTKVFNLSLAEFSKNYQANATRTIKEGILNFFSFNLLPGKYTYLAIFIIAMVFCSRLSTRTELLQISKFMGLLFVIWLVLTPLFETLAFASEFRLLKPYFQFNTFQYLFCLLFLVLIIAIIGFIDSVKLAENNKRLTVVVLLSLFCLISVQKTIGAALNSVHATVRIHYCGSLGCAFDDDHEVIADMEMYYVQFLLDNPEIKSMPRILLPNKAYLANQPGYQERWVMPTGASRMLPFYDVFPSAFFYNQGESQFTFYNYNEFVCESFDLEWLKKLNIQYLYIPTDMMESCIYDLDSILKNNEVLSNHGKSYFIKLY